MDGHRCLTTSSTWYPSFPCIDDARENLNMQVQDMRCTVADSTDCLGALGSGIL